MPATARQFIARDDGLVECVECSSANRPDEFEIVHYRRLEGASDPADMLIVVWSACPTCNAHGTLMLGYGPNATGPHAAILTEFDLHDADASAAAPRSTGQSPAPGSVDEVTAPAEADEGS